MVLQTDRTIRVFFHGSQPPGSRDKPLFSRDNAQKSQLQQGPFQIQSSHSVSAPRGGGTLATSFQGNRIVINLDEEKLTCSTRHAHLKYSISVTNCHRFANENLTRILRCHSTPERASQETVLVSGKCLSLEAQENRRGTAFLLPPTPDVLSSAHTDTSAGHRSQKGPRKATASRFALKR